MTESSFGRRRPYWMQVSSAQVFHFPLPPPSLSVPPLLIVMFLSRLKEWRSSSSSSNKYEPLWAQDGDDSTTKTEDVSSCTDDDQKESLGRLRLRNRHQNPIIFSLGLICGFMLAVVGLLILHNRRAEAISRVQEFAPTSEHT